MKLKVKEIPELERPREKLMHLGCENVSTSELLSILLSNGVKDKNVMELSFELLAKLDSIHDLATIGKDELCSIKGIGEAKAAVILAAIELGKRIFLTKNEKKVKLNTAQDVFEYSKYLFQDKKQELFYCFYVDQTRTLITSKLLFKGTMDRSSVHPREVFKEAYKVSACGIICVHNHPSGNVMPSGKDIEFTKDLIKIGKLQGIFILDHLIVSEHKYYSFGENSNRCS